MTTTIALNDSPADTEARELADVLGSPADDDAKRAAIVRLIELRDTRAAYNIAGAVLARHADTAERLHWGPERAASAEANERDRERADAEREQRAMREAAAAREEQISLLQEAFVRALRQHDAEKAAR
jgi:hypothetical protein